MPRWTLDLMSRLQANVELWNIAVSLQLSDIHNAGLGCKHTKLSFVSVLEECEEGIVKRKLKIQKSEHSFCF
jgi:hypothetical protein